MDDPDRHDPGGPRMTMHLLQAYPAKNKPGALPAAAALLKGTLEEGARRNFLSVRDRIRWRLGRPLLEAATFAKVHDLAPASLGRPPGASHPASGSPRGPGSGGSNGFTRRAGGDSRPGSPVRAAPKTAVDAAAEPVNDFETLLTAI